MTFMWPLIVNTSPKNMILGPALSTLQGQFTTQYPMQMAGAVMAVIPVILISSSSRSSLLKGWHNQELRDKRGCKKI